MHCFIPLLLSSTVQMEVMKREMTQHLDQQAQALSEMRGAALQGFSSLRAEIGDLKEKLGEADQMHKTVSQTAQHHQTLFF